MFELASNYLGTRVIASKFKLRCAGDKSKIWIGHVNPAISNNRNIIRLKNTTITYHSCTLPHPIYIPNSSKIFTTHHTIHV